MSDHKLGAVRIGQEQVPDLYVVVLAEPPAGEQVTDVHAGLLERPQHRFGAAAHEDAKAAQELDELLVVLPVESAQLVDKIAVLQGVDPLSDDPPDWDDS